MQFLLHIGIVCAVLTILFLYWIQVHVAQYTGDFSYTETFVIVNGYMALSTDEPFYAATFYPVNRFGI